MEMTNRYNTLTTGSGPINWYLMTIQVEPQIPAQVKKRKRLDEKKWPKDWEIFLGNVGDAIDKFYSSNELL